MGVASIPRVRNNIGYLEEGEQMFETGGLPWFQLQAWHFRHSQVPGLFSLPSGSRPGAGGGQAATCARAGHSCRRRAAAPGPPWA